MRIDVKITSYSVLHDGISVQLLCNGKTSEEPKDIAAVKGVSQRIRIGDIDIAGVVKSVSLRKGVYILLRLTRSRYVVKRLFELMEEDSVQVVVHSERERTLLCLLDQTAKSHQRQVEDLLYELTTFTGKNGKRVEGRRSIYDISARFQDVVIKKLQKILGEDVRHTQKTDPEQCAEEGNRSNP